MDIRSYFSAVPKKSGTKPSVPAPLRGANTGPVGKGPVVISDDEDCIQQTPEKTSKSVYKRRINVISSDSEDELEKKKKTSKKSVIIEEKLKPVNIDDIFSNKTVKQTKVNPSSKHVKNKVEETKKSKKSKRKTGNPELDTHNDEDFEKTLLDLDDDDILLKNADFLDRTIEEALLKEKEKNTSYSKDSSNIERSVDNIDSQDGSQVISHNDSHKQNKKRNRKNSEGPTSKKAKLEQSDSGIDPDQEAFEKKRYSAMLYERYKNRGGPKHHGEKELPKGKPNCLSNLTFLRTGVLDSLEGEEFENLVKEHGGKVVHGVSKKVNYIVIGDEPGPAKLEKARKYNISEIDENGLLDMILVKSGMPPKFCKNLSEVSNDSGIRVDPAYETDVKETKGIQEKNDKQKMSEVKQNKKITSNDVESKTPNSEIKTNKPNLKKLASDSSLAKDQKITENQTEKSPTEKVKSQKLTESIAEQKTKCSKFAEAVSEEQLKSDKSVEPVLDQNNKSVGHATSWTEKYKPKDVKSIIGQQDQSSNLNKLRKWLMNWYRNQLPEVRKKILRPSPWAKNDDGAYYKAALLSGPPGVGKTTTATLLTKELGFDIVEFNASDTRSKKLLHEEVAQLLKTTTIAGYATGQTKTTYKKRVLLMDEVDGMAGNEDRGGIQELINLIKNTSIPIICMCNDRNHQKMRSLVNYCFDLRFNKPKLEQIRGAMMSICFKEGIKIAPNALMEIINGTGCDVRQTLNHLSMWSAADKNISLETATKESKIAKKDTIMGPWEVVKSVFTESERKNMTVADKSRLFFFDYSLGPLFVQENYLNVTPNCPKKDIMRRVALTADAISKGDLIDSKIRGSNNWSLLESQAMYSSVIPGHYMSGHVTGRINFPGWLGKNSSANKHKRMLSELHIHTRTSTSGSKLAMSLDYLKPLRDSIITPLKKYGTEGVHRAIEVMKSYNLLREDLTNLIELCQWKDTKNPFNDIDAKVKSAFTRAYNKEGPLLPFAPGAGVSKKKASATDDSFLGEELLDGGSEDEGDGDDITRDTMIKVKSKESKAKNDSSKAGSSRGKTASRGGKGKSKKS